MSPRIVQLGPYRLGDKLGQGGMGSVHVGVDGEERVAVKVLAPALAAEEGFRARFEAEIESLKKLRHPNIVRLIAYGEQDGYLYYAMELVAGTSLEEELRQGRRFTWREVTRMSIRICRALKHAHDHGVIHRDIKPANLLLTTDDEVKLSDFGIARLFGNCHMTSEGGVLGTAEYMAPEQADGRVVSDRCDQYSLGGVMYALLAGRPPFRATTLVEMLQLQRFGEPQPVRRFAPDTPAELERIIHQLLSKDPHRRFANTLFLARALEAMELALSRPTRGADFILAHEAPPGMQLTPADPLAMTLSPDESAQSGAATRGPASADAAATHMANAAALARGADAEGSLAADDGAQATDTDTSAGRAARFTKVADLDKAPAPGWLDLVKDLASPQSLALLAGLVIVALVAMWLLRPMSADRLHARIEGSAHGGARDNLLEAEGPIGDFLARFPRDNRAAEVAGYRDELAIIKTERRFERAARRLGDAQTATPLERAYLAAVALEESQPERALAHFRALEALCETSPGAARGSPPDATTERHVLLALARRQRGRLEEQVKRQNDADRRWAQDELQRAAALAATDPAGAAKIRRAIIELFAEKPALADMVTAANEAK